MAKITRRDFLKTGAAGAAATGLTLGFPAVLRPQTKEVVMLGIWPFTGPFADAGPGLDRGMKFAIEEWGNKILGRPIKYITRDSETKAGAATRRVEEAIDSEGVKFVIGPWSSAVALAVTEVAKRRKVFYYFSGGTEDLAGKRCHRYAFQWAASPYTAMHIVVDKFMELHPAAKRWYLFVFDFAFGWSLEKYLKVAGEKRNLAIVGIDRIALGSREFSGFIAKAAAANPDVLCLVSSSQDFILQVREAHNFGLAPKVPIVQPWGLGSEELAQLDGKTRLNLWVGTNGYYAHQSPVAKKYAEGYEKKFGIPPGYPAIAGYSMARMTLRAIERANSVEPADVVKAMEGWETEDWPGRVRVNPKTHQTERDYFLLRCKRPEQMKQAHDYADVIAIGSAPLMPPEINECKDLGPF
jgi:branched-chain amino acid transport system substrate-binding protein